MGAGWAGNVKIVCLPSEKSSTLNVKNANKFFPFRVNPFSEGIWHEVE